jgi:selenoprotein W-related protein
MPRAVRATEELLIEFEEHIERISLVPSNNGVFEVEVDGRLVYSKKKTGRHAQDGEIVRNVHEVLR